jgi:hypothetical protein
MLGLKGGSLDAGVSITSALKALSFGLCASTFSLTTWSHGVSLDAATPSANVLDLPELDDLAARRAAVQVEEEVLDYRSLIREVDRLRSDPNQVRAEDSLRRLEREVKGKLFQFSDTVRVKRNALISRDMAFFFEPIPGQNVILEIKNKDKNIYAKVEEHDFVTAKVRCVELGDDFLFVMEEIVDISPFDGSADFLNYNQWMTKMTEDRKGRLFLEYKDHLSSEVNQHKSQLGYVTGVMLSLSRDRRSGEFVMQMKTDDGQTAHVKCHRSYLQVLRDIQKNSRLSMAVLLENADAKHNYFFKRGCLIKLRD